MLDVILGCLLLAFGVGLSYAGGEYRRNNPAYLTLWPIQTTVLAFLPATVVLLASLHVFTK
jgi:hypothetical protein